MKHAFIVVLNKFNLTLILAIAVLTETVTLTIILYFRNSKTIFKDESVVLTEYYPEHPNSQNIHITSL